MLTIPDSRQYLSPKEVHDLTGISIPQLEVWRREGNGPKFFRIGRLIKYRRDHVEAFLEGREAA
jgi:predicted DNA-binding transcriptional regulator AlpA